MTEHKELCEALRYQPAYPLLSVLRVRLKAADLIEAQAARIAELEKPKAKRLVFDGFVRNISTADFPFGYARVKDMGNRVEASLRAFNGDDSIELWSAYPIPESVEAAQAACQQEFDRIHAEMTEQGP